MARRDKSKMSRVTALIVDDHAEVRTKIARILIQAGFEVIGQAEDGPQALQIAGNLAPSVITLDVSMPGMSGFHVLPELRKQLPGAAIVMLTMNPQYGAEARQRGADGFIVKDRALTELIPVIRSAIVNHQRSGPA